MIGVAGIMAALLAILTSAYWGTVRDHVEAWHFQLTRETEATDPFSVKSARVDDEGVLVYQRPGLEILSVYAKRSIIFDPGEIRDISVWRFNLSADEVRRVLQEEGCRILDQRFPRRAYVVVRDALPPQAEPSEPQMFFVGSGDSARETTR